MSKLSSLLYTQQLCCFHSKTCSVRYISPYWGLRFNKLVLFLHKDFRSFPNLYYKVAEILRYGVIE